MSTLPVHPGADDVLGALDPEQREVAAHPLGPMCVLAGAGTGKTRAITHRVAYGVLSGAYQPQRVLAVTFTARAAGEMRTRLRDLGVGGVQARTFHAAALRQLHYFWPQAIGGPAPEVMPHKAGAVAEAGGRLRLRLDSAAVRDLAAEIEWAKVSMLTADGYPAAVARARREPPAGLDATAMARLLATYEEVKGDRGVIDFEDVLLLMAGILGEHEQVARAVRAQYRHFVVDEYQDVNRLQQTLLELWLGEREDVCVVGDPAQTIYSFTGASPEHLLGFRARHPAARVVELVRNYRSSPQVVGLANLVLRSPGGGRRSGSVELRAQRADGVGPELLVADDDPAEADQVAERIRRHLDDGHPAAQVAVLFRTNGQSELFESALAERGIPYLVRGGERFFSRKEVRDALVLLRGAARSDDGEVALPDLVRDVLVGAGWTREPPAAGGAARERWESLAALAGLADDLSAADTTARLPAFVRELDERAAAQHAPTVQGVTLASLHAAKGLEWDTVFLVGCSDGLLPITMADTPEEVEEERRLLYVGVTRARERLVLSYARARTPGAKATRRPSRFLDGTEPVLGAAARSQPRRRRGSTRERSAAPSVCRVCGGGLATAKERTIGRCAGCPPTMDEQLFEQLRQWRLETARELDVPAYVVFTDATLTAIAERTPGDTSELSRIAGVGPAKLERFGASVLAILEEFTEGQKA
ncbi:ATP-dependent DNA helicase UvrD2 [Phycicoccus endophyticus]|uniref:ATP-dependent DNA helicase UvrD2 n=1 Tax=Phycicoccus endophyticus TaxID=1690220 RepID=UPI00140BF398|nr:ATP-dependent DNA helicase UvrD2 [Phycicoccus endophyticus]NHI20448.1 ATP-dependent DNA helicase UvrD2 [Phycicoccus endophyticus]GGL30668.1 DNA helicase [Phycicoccus endophyticus]